MKAVNLVPADDRRRGLSVGVGRSQGAAYVVLGVLGGLAVLALLYGMARHDASSRRAQLATIAARTQRAQESVSQLTAYTSFMSLREQRMQSVETLVDSRFDWAHAFHELGRVMPHDASITSLDGTIAGASVAGSAASTAAAATAAAGTGTTASSTATSSTPPGSVPSFTLGGCAASQADVALTLQRLRLVDGVSAVNLQSSAKASTSAAGGAAGGHCKPGSPTFTVQVSFDPLPTPSASSGSAAKLTSATGAKE
jgi:Tfp pilus assembly protein PilN